MRDSTQHLLQRLSLWVLGQALPDTGALRAPARLAVTGVLVASAAGTLMALGVVAGLVALYLYLVQEGLSVGASVGLVAGLGFMAGLVVFLYAQRTVEKIPDHFDELKLFNAKNRDVIGDAFNMLVGGFLEGVAEKPLKKAKSKAKKTREEIEASIEELVDQLDMLEAEIGVEEEVVLELKTPRRRKPH
jgi:hypothetical protein